ncbi:MAG: restriction endonuclease subunit S [Kiritimatiellia bacterium]
MGSFQSPQEGGRRRRGRPGKIDAPLGKRLAAVKWGEFKVTKVFKVRNTHCILSAEIVPGSGTVPYLCASADNNAVSSYIDYKSEFKEQGNCIFIGGKTFVVSYQERDFFSNDSHNLALYLQDEGNATKPHLLFMASCMERSLGHKYTRGNSISKQKINDDWVSLPVTAAGEIDFAFMDGFIRELAAYLKVSGLADSKLSASERQALDRFGMIEWKGFRYDEVFNHIEQGRRLKKDDQIPGETPFVMSGITNAGVVNHVANPVASFPANSLTVDIFGNVFYRSYAYGLGDDTGAYWNDEKSYSKDAMLFFAATMAKSLFGKFSYGHKLRSSQSLGFEMLLPATPSGLPDFGYMETFMRAVQKLVIREVADFAAKRISATKQCVGSGCGVAAGCVGAPEEEESLRLAADENGK